MADYVVQTPNADYSGKTLGVRFDGGVARVNEDTVPEALGRSPEQVATMMAKEAGYTVTDSAGAKVFTVPAMPWKEEPSPQPSPIGEGVKAEGGKKK